MKIVNIISKIVALLVTANAFKWLFEGFRIVTDSSLWTHGYPIKVITEDPLWLLIEMFLMGIGMLFLFLVLVVSETTYLSKSMTVLTLLMAMDVIKWIWSAFRLATDPLFWFKMGGKRFPAMVIPEHPLMLLAELILLISMAIILFLLLIRDVRKEWRWTRLW